MDDIRIVYVDDDLDLNISRYLKNQYKIENFNIEYNEVAFDTSKDYDYLISNPLISFSNIIIIDSKLFENNKAILGKFSGEEFKVILRKVFPFIEVIVVTQNEIEDDCGIIPKYRTGTKETSQQYYDRCLKLMIDNAAKNVCIYRRLADKLKANEVIDKVLSEKILSSLDGLSQYDELTTEDIDNIIGAFKEIQVSLDEK
jgi:hypothetical protein